MLLKTFGELSLITDGGPAAGAASQRRRLCLLAVLAEAGERGTTREKLLGMLWPEGGEVRSRAALAQALYALRRDLGSEAVIEGTAALRLNDALLPSDVAQFRAAFAEGRFQAAAELYQGPFLDGVYLPASPSFERWTEETRAALAVMAASAFEKAAAQATAAQDHGTAVALWRRRTALDPYHAPSALGLMRALAAAGDRAAAVRHAQTYATLVRDQLGVEPDAAVEALGEQLRQPGSAAPARPVTVPAARAPSDAPAPVAVPAAAPDPRPAARRTAAVLVTTIIVVALATILTVSLRGPRGQPAPPALPGAAVLAVGAFNGHGAGADELAQSVTDLLSTSLARAPNVTVLSSARVHELLERQRGTQQDSAGALLRAARMGGATAMIDGALYVQPSGIRLDLRRTDLGTGRVIQALTMQAPDLFAAVDSGTRALLSSLAPAPTGSIADVTTSSLTAYRLYSAGLREFHANRRPAAYPLFAAALAEDSLFAMAEFYAWQSAPATDAQVRHGQRAVQLAARASERERLLILFTWADFNDEPVRSALAESLVVRFAADPFAHLALAATLLSQGRFADAVPVARRALVLDRAAPPTVRTGRCVMCEANQTLIAAYRMQDSLDAAERQARAFAREHPQLVEAWYALAEQLQTVGKREEAIAARRRSIELGDPGNLTAYQAWTGLFTTDYEAVDAWFVSVLRTGDAAQRRDAAWWLSISYRAQGRLRDALETARVVRGNADAFGQRGAAPYEALAQAQTLAEMGRAREAAILFDSIARLRVPGITEARIARHRSWVLTHVANSRAMAGDTAGLLALADSIEADGRRSAYARDQRLHHHVRGLVYAARGAHEEAAESFRRAIYSPVVGYTRTNQALARELMALGRPREAVPWLRAALAGGAEGSNLYLPLTDVHEGLALAFAAAGQRDSARVHAALAARAWQRADGSYAERRAAMEALSR